MKALIIFIILTSFAFQSYSQNTTFHKNKWSASAGYGLAGSFFVRSYVENELNIETSFLKKNFLGKTINIGVSREIGKHFILATNYSYQEFKKHIVYSALINSVQLRVNHTIHHINNIYQVVLSRKMEKPKSQTLLGLGLYYLRPIQEEITIWRGFPEAYVTIEDRNFEYNKLEEIGGSAEIGYDYKFQPRVYLGAKCQFFYTISTAEAESIVVSPYIRIIL